MNRRAHIISVSGGKDSTAMLLEALERGVPNLSAVFADTGHEHEEVYKHLDYLERETGVTIQRVKANFKAQIAKKREHIVRKWAEDGVPQSRIDRALEMMVPTGIPMLDLCLWKGRFPSTKARFCSEELKVLPMLNQVMVPALRENRWVWSWQGVRADESRSRAKLPMIQRGRLGVIDYRPILNWTADDVFAMHRKHGIEPNPLYRLGMGRVGCMPCVMCRKSELAEISKRFPEETARIAKWERLVSDVCKGGSTTWFSTAGHSRGEQDVHYSTHGIEEAVKWSKTSRGGRQFDLLTETEPLPSCSSIYGLCE